jgi:hypothetical protein
MKNKTNIGAYELYKNIDEREILVKDFIKREEK